MSHSAASATAPQWWQPQTMALDECWHFTIGPVTLYFKRCLQEWVFGFERSTQPEQAYRVLSQSAACLPEALNMQRFMFRHSPGQFKLTPHLLERAVVIKTHQPVSIPAGEQSVFYISSPVSIEISLQEPSVVLMELPLQRLSDTWFGDSTQQGELCFADKTHARHSLDDIPTRPHRAVTAVTIENRSDRMLTIDKLSIPLPFLALYGHRDGSLWTDPLLLQHESVGQLTRFKIGKTLPLGLTSADLLAPPRQHHDKNSLVRAFTGIFSQ
ncbi:DUF432 domain-containing protein [Alishewanella sp. 16-MA]|uniref:DUF432 domain-containing protein n=1 Tax=Alishewanella maricola TaxID=2795740 RepID=A0ABS8BZ57_9ALTE|nr:DUF432 domain-containing protein [Alishewanella maricola]MCB5225238.1 DUF432 domain-containing protein [Alishewanella maricola]MDP4944395.1 DUF432 domain-containing protein [Alishewanella sp.]MDP5188221.1 DUF432 domain-containing protein [Alishewanella sp.]